MNCYSTNRNENIALQWGRNNPDLVNREERTHEKCRRHLRIAKMTSAEQRKYEQKARG